MEFMFSSFLCNLSHYIVPCIILGLLEYIIILKYSKYKYILPISCFVYGVVKSIWYLRNINSIAQAIPYIDKMGYVSYSVLSILAYFSMFILLFVLFTFFSKKECEIDQWIVNKLCTCLSKNDLSSIAFLK